MEEYAKSDRKQNKRVWEKKAIREENNRRGE